MVWQSRGALGAQRQYWKRQLAGAPLLLELPTDRVRPAQPTGRGSSVPVLLPADVTASLRDLAADCGVTMFAALTAAWQARPAASVPPPFRTCAVQSEPVIGDRPCQSGLVVSSHACQQLASSLWGLVPDTSKACRRFCRATAAQRTLWWARCWQTARIQSWRA